MPTALVLKYSVLHTEQLKTPLVCLTDSGKQIKQAKRFMTSSSGCIHRILQGCVTIQILFLISRPVYAYNLKI